MVGASALAVGVAAGAAFVASLFWYITFGKERLKLLVVDPAATGTMRAPPATPVTGS